MIDSASEKFVVDPKQRRREIEQCLSSCNLGPEPRRLFREESSHHAATSKVERLCKALESLGPVFSAFGSYLSTRVDLVPLQDCLALASLREADSRMTTRRVHEILQNDLGKAPEQIFLHFDSEPFKSNLSFQVHNGRFPDGTPVTIKITDPDLTDRIECELPFLDTLEGAIEQMEWSSFSFDAMVEDFSRSVYRTVSRSDEAAMLNTLSEDAKGFEVLCVPEVFERFSAAHILTVERLPGWPMDSVGPSRFHTDFGVHKRTDHEAATLARRLCYVWLRQAIYGRYYPVGFATSDITALPSDKIAWSGGTFTSMPSASKENVWNYLTAAAAANPDRAYEYLIQEMEEESRAQGDDGLRNRLRQVVPFRDGAWQRSGNADTLAEHLFVHWRLAREHGFRPRLHLLDFYRGLFSVTATAQRLAPGDSLREGMKELKMTVGLGEMKDMMNPQMWGEVMEQYAGTVIELPRKLDELLIRAKSGDLLKQFRGGEAPPARLKAGAVATVGGLVCLLVATVVVSRHISPLVGNPEWIQGGSTAILLLCGFMIILVLRKKH
ncbi:MAG: AarF/ABC1/UbiB kinase family protein [Candidatus Latescibacteria bacterium]|nr:AarF/ABC1/UbiB kinase family protein [Candidatus Latescibacterota bacterium]